MPLGWLHRGHVGLYLSSVCFFNLMNLNFLVSSCNFLCFRSYEESFGQLKSRCVPAPPLSICFLMHEARSEAHAQIEKVAVDCKNRELTVDAKQCFRHPCNTIHHIKIQSAWWKLPRGSLKVWTIWRLGVGYVHAKGRLQCWNSKGWRPEDLVAAATRDWENFKL